MKVLLTGGAGYIGSMCGRRLVEAGHEIAVFDDFSLGHRKALVSDVRIYEGDLRDAPVIEQAVGDFGPDAVMHFAALALVGESMLDPGRYFSVNVSGGLNLLQAMAAHSVKRLVFSSTCATYGVPDELPIRETTPQVPINRKRLTNPSTQRGAEAG